jgi:hypothetical protein
VAPSPELAREIAQGERLVDGSGLQDDNAHEGIMPGAPLAAHPNPGTPTDETRAALGAGGARAVESGTCRSSTTTSCSDP